MGLSARLPEIPTDRRHEFFSSPLAVDDPDLHSWRRHFRTKGVPVKEVRYASGVQFYIHRIIILDTGRKKERLCCPLIETPGRAKPKRLRLNGHTFEVGVARRLSPRAQAL